MSARLPTPPQRPFSTPPGPHCPTCLLGGRSGACGIAPGSGYFPGEGSAHTGLMIVSDHLGGDDKGDRALVGPSGFILGQVMKRLGLARSDVYYETVLRCQPTQPIRDKGGRRAPWLSEAVNHCTPSLNAAIQAKRPHVFLALGDLAFETLTGIDLRAPLNMNAVRGYVFPERHGRGWVVATHHPEIMRLGQWEFATTLQWDLQRALGIAKHGFSYEDDLVTLMDPSTEVWEKHVERLCGDLRAGRVPHLASDIETPYKRGRRNSEKGDESATEDPTYTIDRISLCGHEKIGVSVPWRMPYLPGIMKVHEMSVNAKVPVIFWNRAYDRPRLIHNNLPLPIGATADTMDYFHLCFNHLPKKLGFATSCLPRSSRFRMWKHLASSQPALYSVMDVLSLFRNHLDCGDIARATGQQKVYEEIMLSLDPALEYMTSVGMPIDTGIQGHLSTTLGARLKVIERELDTSVPESIKEVQVWKSPKAAEKGMQKLKEKEEIYSDASLIRVDGERKAVYCGVCGEVDVKTPHVTNKTVEGIPELTQGGLFD